MYQTQVNYLNYQESVRSHKAQESLSRSANEEVKRHDLSSEAETTRHNKATEYQQARQTDESIRHNLVTERETNRSNLAREAETYRSNRAREQEAQRSNMAREYLQAESINETIRSNKANEALKAQSNAETARSNRAREQISATSNQITAAHNKEMEKIGFTQAQIAEVNAKTQRLSTQIQKAALKHTIHNDAVRNTINALATFAEVNYKDRMASNAEKQTALTGLKLKLDAAVAQKKLNLEDAKFTYGIVKDVLNFIPDSVQKLGSGIGSILHAINPLD